MANTPAMCNSFKLELLTGQHNLGVGYSRATTSADTIKAALYTVAASPAITNGTTIYQTAGEVGASGSYSLGGINVTNGTAPLLYTNTATWTPSASIQATSFTSSGSFDTVLLYNSTNGNRAIASYGIGAQTITSGTLTLTMPSPGAGTSLINIA
jgi:hypothetical protein